MTFYLARIGYRTVWHDMKQYRRLVCVRRSHLKKLAPIAMLFIMLVFMLLTFATPASAIWVIQQPSFEVVTDPPWAYSESDTDFTGTRSPDWSTQGDYSYLLSCPAGSTITTKKLCQIQQSVDFNKLDTISFDAKLYSIVAGQFEARVIVGSTTVWSKVCPTTTAEYIRQEVDVSAYTGTQNLIFQIYAPARATSATTTNYFDNIKTWGSFSDLAHNTVHNDFTTGENHVYMYGENFESGTYHVGFYDAGDYKICSDGTLTTNTLAAECEFTHGIPGTWHAVVYEGETPPATYDPTNRVVEDSFTVQSGAIPEFPAVIAAIAVCMLCAFAYVVMRRWAERG